MKKFKIPIVWSMVGSIEVKANSLTEAQEKAKEKFCEPGFPEDAFYLEDSMELDGEGEEIK